MAARDSLSCLVARLKGRPGLFNSAGCFLRSLFLLLSAWFNIGFGPLGVAEGSPVSNSKQLLYASGCVSATRWLNLKAKHPLQNFTYLSAQQERLLWGVLVFFASTALLACSGVGRGKRFFFSSPAFQHRASLVDWFEEVLSLSPAGMPYFVTATRQHRCPRALLARSYSRPATVYAAPAAQSPRGERPYCLRYTTIGGCSHRHVTVVVARCCFSQKSSVGWLDRKPPRMYVVPTVSPEGERQSNTAVAAFLELSECVIGAASKAFFVLV